MSAGRRTGNDQSILEMLERDTGRGQRRSGRRRLAWYGAGGALAAGLIGLLAWLTHDTAPPQEAQPIAVAEVAPAPGRAARADAAAELMGINELDEPARPHHAAVIDEQLGRQQKPITAVAMLTPAGQPVPATASADKGAVVRDDPPASTSAAKQPSAAAGGVTAKTQARRPAAEPSRARATAKPATATKTPPTVRNTHDKLAHNAPRARKPAAPAPASRPVVDSDVALISAVIQHSTARAGSTDCTGPSCAAKTTAQP
jgi:hypothetical protein